MGGLGIGVLTQWLVAVMAPLLASDLRTVSAGLGVYSQSMFSVTRSKSGSMAPFGTLYPTLGFLFQFSKVEPAFQYTLAGRTAGDDAATVSFLTVQVPWVHRIEMWTFKVGPAAEVGFISGRGGSTTLRDGTGMSHFALPRRTRVTSIVMLDFGGSFLVLPRFRLDLDLMVSGILSSRRSLSMLIQGGYELY